MVSRSDPKPLYYLATAYRALRPVVVSNDQVLFTKLLGKIRSIKNLPLREYLVAPNLQSLESFSTSSEYIYDSIASDCERSFDPYMSAECTAAFMAKNFKGRRPIIKDRALAQTITKCYHLLFENVTNIYHGSEAAIMMMDRFLHGKLSAVSHQSENIEWAMSTALETIVLQASACMQNADGIQAVCAQYLKESKEACSAAFTMFANAEKALYRSGTRHNYMSHLYFSNCKVSNYTPNEDLIQNFSVTLTDLLQIDVKVYKILGNTIVLVAGNAYIMSSDDIISFCKMARAYVNGVVYFGLRVGDGGVHPNVYSNAMMRISSLLVEHIHRGESYAKVLRAFNLYNMSLFNSLEEKNIETRFMERSAYLMKEVYALCPGFNEIEEIIKKLKLNDYDALNIVYLYHAFVGDDAGVDDIITKLRASTDKPKETKYDHIYFNKFLTFLKSYTLSRFMTVNRRIPNTAGVTLDQEAKWVVSCLKGKFKMPPHSELGKTYISNEFTFNEYIRFWDLDAGDVTLIINNPSAYLGPQGMIKPELSNELLYVLKNGNILDHETRSTPEMSLNNLINKVERKTTTLVAAAKNENTKPTNKKRVTFAADGEFRHMQSMVDKNIHHSLNLIPGSVLGLGHRDIEKRFRSIASYTILDNHTLNTSQDVDGWSESQERDKFIAFMKFALEMTNKPEMINIEQWWAVIQLIFNKMGTAFSQKMPDGGFQGMPVRQDSIEHAGIILFFVHEMKHLNILPPDMRVLHNICVDDCVASFITENRNVDVMLIFNELSKHYVKLGYKLDYYKSIISYTKAIFCSRRFCKGIEVASDMKTIMKMGVPYDMPLHSPSNVLADYMATALGALTAGGKILETYYIGLMMGLATLTLYCPSTLRIPPNRAAVYCLIIKDDNGWGVPDMIQWSTKDVIDTRTRSNCIFQCAAETVNLRFTEAGLSESQARVWGAVKCQNWDTVKPLTFFNNPFRAVKEGPPLFNDVVTATIRPFIKQYVEDPSWKNLIDMEDDNDFNSLVAELIKTPNLDATIINAIAQCMPGSFAHSMQAKSMSSKVVQQALPQNVRYSLRRRCSHLGIREIMYLEDFVFDANYTLSRADIALLNPHEYTISERDAFYAHNDLNVINHTFPDPVLTFSQVSQDLSSSIDYSLTNFTVLAKLPNGLADIKATRGRKGLFVPPKSANVLEYTSKKFDAWDAVTKKIVAGMVILGVAQDHGHKINGLKMLFIKSWDAFGNADLDSPILASTRGASKRLSQNPGSFSHPLFAHKNLSQSINVNLTTSIAALPAHKHMHDVLGSIMALRACSVITVSYLLSREVKRMVWNMGLRSEMIIRHNEALMNTDHIIGSVYYCIDNATIPWGFAQSHPELSVRIKVVTVPQITAKYVTAVMTQSKVDYDQLMHDIEVYINKVGERKLFLEPVMYPSDMKDRGVIVTTSQLTIKDPLSLLVKTTPIQPIARADAYSAGIPQTRYKMITAAIPHVPNVKTAITLLRTTLLYEMQSVSLSTIASAALDEKEFITRMRPIILKDVIWSRLITACNSVFPESEIALILYNMFAKAGCVGFKTAGEITVESLKSFAGIHIKELCDLILPEYSRIIGGSAGQYDKKPMIITIAADADRINRRKRYVALCQAKIVTLKVLKERLKAIEENKVKHWGDKAFIENKGNASIRQNQLRIRRSALKALEYDEDLTMNTTYFAPRMAKMLNKVQRNIIKRHHMSITPINIKDEDARIETINLTLKTIQDRFDETNKLHGFDAELGTYSINEVKTWFKSDISREKSTLYAVTPGSVVSKYSHIISAPVQDLETVRERFEIHSIEKDDEIEVMSGESYHSSEEDALEYFERIEEKTSYPLGKVSNPNTGETYNVVMSKMTDVILPFGSNWKNPEELEREKMAEIANKDKETKKKEGYTAAQKSLMVILLNDNMSMGALQSILKSNITNKVAMYRYIDPLNRPDSWIKQHFGDVVSQAENCEEGWDDSMITILSELDEDDDVAVN